MYCKKCGGKIESYASHCPFCGEPLANNNVQSTYTTVNVNQPSETKGIGSWILTYIIVGLPVIGLIMLLVWSFGYSTKANPTFRNWARAQLLVYVIVFVASFLFVSLFAEAILDLMNELAASMPQ